MKFTAKIIRRKFQIFDLYFGLIIKIMAIVSGESIKLWATLKPSSFAVWCALCDVKQSDSPDVYLTEEKAKEYGVSRSAYFHAFNELAENKWIEFSRKFDGKKWFKLVKGFSQKSANVDFQTEAPSEKSANVDFQTEAPSEKSANVDFQTEAPSEKSANVDSEKSANVDSHIRNNSPLPQDSNESFGEGGNTAEKPKPVKTRLPENFPLTDEMIDWAKSELPKLRLIEAHENFVEYWANVTTKKGERVDWNLTWKKGMRMALKWQIRDEEKAKNGVGNGIIQQNNNFKSSADKRDERAISSFERKQQLRAKVEARRIGIS